VERAPLPPHERAWRHPSELAAANRAALSADEPSSTSRTIALVGGAAGVLAVALLVLTLAPRRNDTPVAVSSTSSPDTPTSAQLVAPASLGRDITGLSLHPIATPIGDDGLALTTSRSIFGVSQDDIRRADNRLIDVELVTGHVTRALVVDPGENGGIAWVSLDDGAYDHGLDVASDVPLADDVVTVLAHPPMLVEFAHIEQVEAADGTPVIDDDGDVVGLCMQDDDSGDVDFTPIGELVDDAPTGEQD
jgi:hypothetical protein